MADVSTTYLGLTLKNPIIVGSSGLTASVKGVKRLEDSGAAAVVLKSVFEEEIALEYEQVLEQAVSQGFSPEAMDYYDQEIRGERLDAYVQLVSQSKKTASIPVIASINCTYSHEWAFFAKELESAGADALELNMFFLPTDFGRSSAEQERAYFDVIDRVKSQTSIPISLKISRYFSSLGPMIQRLSNTGVSGLVLFNRFFNLDFDIEELRVVPTNVHSTPAEHAIPLRWIAIMAKRVNCDLVASTGIHDGSAVIKQLLAGAKAVQVVSALYKHGTDHIQTMLGELTQWMTRHEYYGLEQFVGTMSQSESDNPALYERAQFMRYFGGKRWALRS